MRGAGKQAGEKASRQVRRQVSRQAIRGAGKQAGEKASKASEQVSRQGSSQAQKHLEGIPSEGLVYNIFVRDSCLHLVDILIQGKHKRKSALSQRFLCKAQCHF